MSRDLLGLDAALGVGRFAAQSRPASPPPAPRLATPAGTPAGSKTGARAVQAQRDAQVAASKVKADAAAAAQKLTTAAAKSAKRFPRQSKSLLSLAAAVKSRGASTAAKMQRSTIHGEDPFASIFGEIFGETFVVGDIAMLVQGSRDVFTAVNSAVICNDIMNSVDNLVSQLPTTASDLIATGNAIVSQCQGVIGPPPSFDPSVDPIDLTIVQTVQSIQGSANAWISQAQSALAGSPMATSTANAQAVQQAQALLSTIQGLVQQLNMIGEPGLAQQGSGLVTSLSALIANPNDVNLPANFATLQTSAAQFQLQAQQVLANAGGGGSAGGGSAGGGGGGGGGGSDGGGGGSDGTDPSGGFDPGGGGGGGQDDGSQGGDDSTASFEQSADAQDAAEADPNAQPDTTNDDLFADVVGEILGNKLKKHAAKSDGAKVFGDRATVLAVQKALVTKGFDPETDGVAGPKTAKAIRLMQLAAGRPETGVVDHSVLAALKVKPPHAVGASGDSGAQVVHSPPTTPAPTGAASLLDYFHKPLWTGSRVNIWQATVGAGVAVVLSSVLLAVLRRKR